MRRTRKATGGLVKVAAMEGKVVVDAVALRDVGDPDHSL